MGKPGKWLKNFLTGKKDKEGDTEVGVKDEDKPTNWGIGGGPVAAENPITPMVLPPTTPREKRRWSFRRSSANSAMPAAVQPGVSDSEDDQRKHAMTVAAAAAAAADAAAAAVQAAAAVMMLTAAANGRSSAIEEAAAVRIQSAFRSYLARKALRALRGLVKLQALVRGHLVRKQAKATLHCMQALVMVQARVRAQRLRTATEDMKTAAVHARPSTHRKSTQDSKFKNLYKEIDPGMMEENIKIVEMDLGEPEPKPSVKSRKSYSYPNHPQPERMDHRFSMHCPPPRAYSSQDKYQHESPAPSALTEMRPRTCSGYFEDYALCTTQSNQQCYSAMSKPDLVQIPSALPRPDYSESLSYDYPLYPNYMANTESSRAKARSQSAPKQRPLDYFERLASRRRPSIEGRGIPRGSTRMQRSSSHVGSAIQGYQYPPWSVRQLDRSTVSLVGSECGSTTSTVMTNTNYCKSLVSFDVRGRGHV